MGYTIHREFEQRSEKWNNMRAGIITASGACKIIGMKGEASNSKTYRHYCRKQAFQRVFGYVNEEIYAKDLERGRKLEDEALAHLQIATLQTVETVGFVMDDSGYFGFSPDGLTKKGETFIELKCPRLENHLTYAFNSDFPNEYWIQMQFGMLVMDVEHCYFGSYCDSVKSSGKFLYRIFERDKEYTEKLRVVIEKTNDDINELVEQLNKGDMFDEC